MEATKDKKESKNPLTKLKEAIDDKEEQLAILGTFIRLGVMVWAGFIISLNYISLPGISSDKAPKDITFIASVFTGCLATFNVTPGVRKEEDKEEAVWHLVPTQIIRIEQAL